MTPLQEFCATAGPRPIDPMQHRHLCLLTRDHTAEGEAHRCHLCKHAWMDQSEADRKLLSALEGQLNTLRLEGLSVANVQVVVQTGPNFVDDKRRFRITGELIPADDRPSSTAASPHACWDDGQPVAIPGKALTELEAAWRDAQRWSIAHQVADPLHDDAPFLDHVEQHMLEEVVRGAVKAGRALLTNSGPLWTVRPLDVGHFGERVDVELAASGTPWSRGTPLPFTGVPVWLMCRMSGLSIPLLPEVKP